MMLHRVKQIFMYALPLIAGGAALNSPLMHAAAGFDIALAGVDEPINLQAQPTDDWLLAAEEDFTGLAVPAVDPCEKDVCEPACENLWQFCKVLDAARSRLAFHTMGGKCGRAKPNDAIAARGDKSVFEDLIAKAAVDSCGMIALVNYLTQLLSSAMAASPDYIASSVNSAVAAFSDLISVAHTTQKFDANMLAQIWRPVRCAVEPYGMSPGKKIGTERSRKRERAKQAKRRAVRFCPQTLVCPFGEKDRVAVANPILLKVATKA